MDYEKMIDDFNDGASVEDIFGSLSVFFEFARRKKLLHLIDYQSSHAKEWLNEFLIFLYENKQLDLFNDIVLNELSDVKMIDGKFYYWHWDRDELPYFFCDKGRRRSSRDVAEKVFGESDMYDWFNETTDDVYRDVILELSKENLEKLKKIIISNLSDIKVSPDSELLELLSEEQNSDYVMVNTSNIDRIIDDSETVDVLLNDELSELRNNLYSLHHTSYASAYENDLWKEAWGEMSRFFIGQGEYIQVPTNTKNSRYNTQFVLEFKDFYGLILEFLYDNRKYTDTIGYHSYIYYIIREIGKCLELSAPDYPSSREVDKNINELFNDYIYE